MLRTEALAAAAALALTVVPEPVLAACTVSATGVAFGAYDTLSAAPDDSAGAITADCHPSDHAPTVSLGTGGSGSFTPRWMSGGTGGLDYNLYTDAGRSLIWGDGTAGTATVTLSGGVVSAGRRRFDRPMYGRIPARQAVVSGTYSDTLFVTISF